MAGALGGRSRADGDLAASRRANRAWQDRMFGHCGVVAGLASRSPPGRSHRAYAHLVGGQPPPSGGFNRGTRRKAGLPPRWRWRTRRPLATGGCRGRQPLAQPFRRPVRQAAASDPFARRPSVAHAHRPVVASNHPLHPAHVRIALAVPRLRVETAVHRRGDGGHRQSGALG